MNAFKQSFFEDTNLPANPKPFTVYYTQNGTIAEVHATNREGQYMMVGNTELMTKLIKLLVPKSYTGFSDTPITINAGPISIRTQQDLAYIPGQLIRLTYDSSNYMQGIITAYNVDVMDITINFKIGSGTYHAWVLSPGTDTLLPSGGNTNEVLKKSSATDYAVVWAPASSGGGISTFATPGNANFSLADGTGFEIPSNTLTADRTIDVSTLTTEAEVYNGDQTYRLLFTGATVYADGGANVVTEAPAMRTCRFRKVGSKIFIIN